MSSFELIAKRREKVGTAVARRMRRIGEEVPAVVYGAKQPTELISLQHNQLIKALRVEAFHSQIITLLLDGKSQQVVLKAVQKHPTKLKALHVDFLRIEKTEKLTIMIPLHFMGAYSAPGLPKPTIN